MDCPSAGEDAAGADGLLTAGADVDLLVCWLAGGGHSHLAWGHLTLTMGKSSTNRLPAHLLA
jgi:hypothetical protein